VLGGPLDVQLVERVLQLPVAAGRLLQLRRPVLEITDRVAGSGIGHEHSPHGLGNGELSATPAQYLPYRLAMHTRTQREGTHAGTPDVGARVLAPHVRAPLAPGTPTTGAQPRRHSRRGSRGGPGSTRRVHRHEDTSR